MKQKTSRKSTYVNLKRVQHAIVSTNKNANKLVRIKFSPFSSASASVYVHLFSLDARSYGSDYTYVASESQA